MRILDVRVDVTPIPWRRPAQGRAGRRFTAPTLRAYRDEISWALKLGTVGRSPTTELVAVSIVFHTNRGDLDNLAKVILDAGNGIVWADDRQVVELHVYRRRLATGAKRDPIWVRAETVAGPDVPSDLRYL